SKTSIYIPLFIFNIENVIKMIRPFGSDEKYCNSTSGDKTEISTDANGIFHSILKPRSQWKAQASCTPCESGSQSNTRIEHQVSVLKGSISCLRVGFRGECK